MSKRVEIRPAVSMDTVKIIQLIKAGWKESVANVLAELDENNLFDFVANILKASNAGRAFCVVAEMDGRLLGSLALLPFNLPWAAKKDIVLMESWFVVAGSHRNRDDIPEALLDTLEAFLVKTGRRAVLGSNVAAPSVYDSRFKARGYEMGRATFMVNPDQFGQSAASA